jgi:hypothetical protein
LVFPASSNACRVCEVFFPFASPVRAYLCHETDLALAEARAALLGILDKLEHDGSALLSRGSPLALVRSLFAGFVVAVLLFLLGIFAPIVLFLDVQRDEPAGLERVLAPGTETDVAVNVFVARVPVPEAHELDARFRGSLSAPFLDRRAFVRARTFLELDRSGRRDFGGYSRVHHGIRIERLGDQTLDLFAGEQGSPGLARVRVVVAVQGVDLNGVVAARDDARLVPGLLFLQDPGDLLYETERVRSGQPHQLRDLDHETGLSFRKRHRALPGRVDVGRRSGLPSVGHVLAAETPGRLARRFGAIGAFQRILRERLRSLRDDFFFFFVPARIGSFLFGRTSPLSKQAFRQGKRLAPVVLRIHRDAALFAEHVRQTSGIKNAFQN